MATIDGIPLTHEASSSTCGAAFRLRNPATASEAQPLGKGWVIEIRKGSQFVVARGVGVSGYSSVVPAALDAAQQGLDLMSVRGAADLAAENPAADPHLSWWLLERGLTVRYTDTLRLRVQTGGVTAVVRDASGAVIPPTPEPPAEWHSSFRYFRLSQITDDLADAYRNRWLALESLLDEIRPKTSAETESEWVLGALEAAGGRVPLDGFIPPETVNAPEWLYRELYERRRNAIFHAKPSREPLLPHGSYARRQLLEAHDTVARLYLNLMQACLGVRRLGGGLMLGGFDLMTAPLDDKLRLWVTDDPPVEDINTATETDDIALAGGTVRPLSTRRHRPLDRPFLKAFVGRTTSQDPPLERVTRVVARDGATPMGVSQVDGTLDQVDVVRFEAQLNVLAENVQLPRVEYSL